MASEGPVPTPEDKARYDAAKEELVKALTKKRDADKRLVRPKVEPQDPAAY